MSQGNTVIIPAELNNMPSMISQVRQCSNRPCNVLPTDRHSAGHDHVEDHRSAKVWIEWKRQERRGRRVDACAVE
jgi:hypothetical protein